MVIFDIPKIPTHSVYSFENFPKFKYTIQQPASKVLPTSKIHTLSVYQIKI